MEDLILTLVTLVLLVFVVGVPVAFLYRYRANIKRWITDSSYCVEWNQDAVKRAHRGVTKAEWKLEDAQDYLTFKMAEKSKEQDKENPEE